MSEQNTKLKYSTENNVNFTQYRRLNKYIVQYSTVQYSAVQYSTLQYSTVQYSTLHYSTVQYSTVHCFVRAVECAPNVGDNEALGIKLLPDHCNAL